MSLKQKPDELFNTINFNPPAKDWMDTTVDFSKRGCYNAAAVPDSIKYVEQANPRKWQPYEDNWKLPENWQEIILEGLRVRIKKFRSLQLFMDICVRCGACADKCHFFIGSGDPKNMPVLRAELLRSVYRKEFSKAGKIMGKMVGAQELTFDVLKQWFYYFYQCTQCRRCSVFCPYGIDTAEITFLARELMNLIGVNIDWVMTPVANCHRTGNHLGIQPHGFVDSLEFARDDLEDITGIRVDLPINKKGAEILFITPSADYFGEPHYFTLLGYLALFHELKLDYTWSTYASEGGNFGSFVSHELMRALNAKFYAEAKRLGVKWILGGECGHMWRVVHQYMNTLSGPPDFLEVPKSPITGTVFENAKSAKMVHISEFTADLIKNNKLKLDPCRNNHWHATFHDSCNPARGMGLIEEPRYIIKNVMNKFSEMPDSCIKEQTFCCGSGAGLGTEENLEMRMRGGMPRGNAVKYVRDTNGVNILLCMCAIDKATLPGVVEYWAPGVEVGGVHEMVGNALIMEGEKERETDFRMQPLIKSEPEIQDDNGKEGK
ncbi:MAG: (Fe-S)-binding protein [bacterium]